MPITPVMNGGINAPLEGDDESVTSGFRAMVGNAQESTFGAEAIEKAYAAFDTRPGAQTMIPKVDVTAQLKAQNYGADGVPEEGMTQSALIARMNHQSYLRRTQDMAARAGMGSTSQFVAGVIGGLGDPLNILIAPAIELGGPIRLALAGRVALGAAEGSAVVGGIDVAKNHLLSSMGDEDASSAQIMRDMLFGAAVGGVLHGAFGPRPVAVPGGAPVTLDMIDKLGERTGNYSAKTGIPVDQVVSNKGAVGRYQVTPIFAKNYGVTQEQIDAGLLRNPEFNAKVAQRGLDDLNKRFPNDPEAVAIAYNAGPSVARRFIQAGRDYSMLPKETQDYAARFAGVPREARLNAARVAVAQAETDSPIRTEPVVDGTLNDTFRTNPMRIMDEHDAEMDAIHSDALRRIVPRQDSLFTDDPEIAASIDRTDRSYATTKQPVSNTEPVVEQSAALDPELMQHVTNDLAEAKTLSARLGEDETTPHQFEEPEPFHIDGMPAEEHQKAVEAAVRCGFLKGGFSGT